VLSDPPATVPNESVELIRPLESAVADPPLPWITSPAAAAFAGATATTARKPAPNADTATSAMRLRSVLKDIFFLSISQIKYFLNWLEWSQEDLSESIWEARAITYEPRTNYGSVSLNEVRLKMYLKTDKRDITQL
jgi:hypothetical protein